MNIYEALKLIHIASVVISISLFVYRFFLLNRRPELALVRWLKIAPHINDTLLLAAAIGMLVVAQLNPLDVVWLKTKIAALIIYIVLGSLCLHAPPRSAKQVVLFTLAFFTFSYIVYVALTKTALLTSS